jgi:hypothetical protein
VVVELGTPSAGRSRRPSPPAGPPRPSWHRQPGESPSPGVRASITSPIGRRGVRACASTRPSRRTSCGTPTSPSTAASRAAVRAGRSLPSAWPGPGALDAASSPSIDLVACGTAKAPRGQPEHRAYSSAPASTSSPSAPDAVPVGSSRFLGVQLPRPPARPPPPVGVFPVSSRSRCGRSGVVEGRVRRSCPGRPAVVVDLQRTAAASFVGPPVRRSVHPALRRGVLGDLDFSGQQAQQQRRRP